MGLLTKTIRKALPKLHAKTGMDPEDVKVVVKFFTPDSNWTWYAIEFDGHDTFFGLVSGSDRIGRVDTNQIGLRAWPTPIVRGGEVELGSFSLKELESVRGPLGLAIQRDRSWKGTLADAYKAEGAAITTKRGEGV